MNNTIRIGRVQPVLKGAWDSSIPYTPMDVVSTEGEGREGGYYWCLKDNIGINPITDTNGNWLEVGSEGIKKAQDKGQIGDPINLGEVDANTITETGIYVVNLSTDTVYKNHWPYKISAESLIRVYNTGTIIQQKIDNKHYQLIRSCVNNEWNNWSVIYGDSNELHLYISKNGSDSNLGLTSDTPVQTIPQAITIANSFTSSGAYNQVYFHIGAGDWGDISIMNLSYATILSPYDGNKALQYSEELPKFNTVNITSCFLTINSLCIDKLYVANAYVGIGTGYKKINRCQVFYNSYLFFYHSIDNTNIWEIGESSNNIPVVECYFCSRFLTGQIKVKLASNITNSPYFLKLGQGCTAILTPTNSYDYNGFTFSGSKYNLIMGSFFDTPSDDPYSVLNSLFGTVNGASTSNSIINGVSTGNLQKTGGTLTGSLVIENDLPVLALRNNRISQGTPDTESQSCGSFVIQDKNAKTVGAIYYNSYYSSLILVASPNENQNYVFSICGINNVGVILGPTQLTTDIDGRALACQAYVRAKLGTGTSTVSLTSLDETSEDYVETTEITQQKYIAQINSEVQQTIYNGFPYEIDGKQYIIPSSLFDQQNLNSMCISAINHPDNKYSLVVTDMEDGSNIMKEVTASQIIDIQNAGVIFRESILKDAFEKKEKIKSVDSEEEMKKIYMG